jgi:predicted methyltransferase
MDPPPAAIRAASPQTKALIMQQKTCPARPLSSRTLLALLAMSASALMLSACTTPAVGNTAAVDNAAASNAAAYQAAINSPARADDRKGDDKRKPAEFLAFAKVRPGMKVLDLQSAAGATATLLAAAVGPSGEVFAHNYKPSPKLDARLAASPMPNLHQVVAPFENPVPAGTPPLDLVTINMNYHDLVNEPVDRAAMNKRVYEALKPGGYYVVIDNAAKAGSGLADTKTLHRIDEAAVIAEVTQAGFKLDGKGDYLRVPSDPRDQPFFKMEGKPDDKFALRFVR